MQYIPELSYSSGVRRYSELPSMKRATAAAGETKGNSDPARTRAVRFAVQYRYLQDVL